MLIRTLVLLVSVLSHPLALAELPKILSSTPQYLPLEKAFGCQAHFVDKKLVIEWHIQPGYLLYTDSITIHLQPEGDNKVIQLVFIANQSPKTFDDPHLGQQQVYSGLLSLDIAVEPQSSIIEAKYQGCAEKGFCYPPSRCIFKLNNIEQSLERLDLGKIR